MTTATPSTINRGTPGSAAPLARDGARDGDDGVRTQLGKPSRVINVGATERVVSSLVGSALLLGALRRPSPGKVAVALGASALLHRGITGHCYVNQALGRNTAVQAARRPRSITIEATPESLFRAWSDPEHVSALLGDFGTVEGSAEGEWRWQLELPMGKSLSWTTTVQEAVPNEQIAWRTSLDAPFVHAGWVRFRPAPRDWGTEVTLQLTFEPSAGALSVERLLNHLPKTLEDSILRRCKSLMVAGEIPSLRGNPAARERPALAASRILAPRT